MVGSISYVVSMCVSVEMKMNLLKIDSFMVVEWLDENVIMSVVIVVNRVCSNCMWCMVNV